MKQGEFRVPTISGTPLFRSTALPLRWDMGAQMRLITPSSAGTGRALNNGGVRGDSDNLKNSQAEMPPDLAPITAASEDTQVTAIISGDINHAS